MKLNNIENDPSSTPPTIESDYNNTYGVVPAYWAKVASRASGTTDMDEGSSFTTTYAVYASSNQHAGTYVGQVKYVLTHPATDAKHLFMQDIAQLKDKILLNEGDSTRLVDQRDGKAYWVTRLADGNIWMTQNLDLDLDPTKPLTSNDTDLLDYSLAGAYADGYSYDVNSEVITWTPERKTIDFQNNTTTGWANDGSNPYSANKTDSTETGHASLGNYYNWTAAIASNNSSSLTQNTPSDITKNPQNSICPKGWRLPTISNQSANVTGSTNEFARLNYIYNNGSTTTNSGLINAPLYFVKPGWVEHGLDGLGQYGYYYSSSYTGASAFLLSISENTNNNAQQTYPRNDGFSIRCVAR